MAKRSAHENAVVMWYPTGKSNMVPDWQSNNQSEMHMKTLAQRLV